MYRYRSHGGSLYCVHGTGYRTGYEYRRLQEPLPSRSLPQCDFYVNVCMSTCTRFKVRYMYYMYTRLQGITCTIHVLVVHLPCTGRLYCTCTGLYRNWYRTVGRRPQEMYCYRRLGAANQCLQVLPSAAKCCQVLPSAAKCYYT